MNYLSVLLNLNNPSDKLSYTLFERLVDKIYGDMISDDPMEPQEIHLSLTGLPTEMKVMWITMDNLLDPYVEYKSLLADENCWIKASAINNTYEVPQNWWPTFQGVIYEANLISLEPSIEYMYRVKGFDNVNKTYRSSDTFIFRAAPLNEPDRITRIATLADQGTFMLLGFAVQDKLEASKYDLEIDLATVVGDLSYAGLSSDIPLLNITKEDEFEHIWDLYGIQSQPVAATMPWMVTNGNHERFYNYSAFRNRYSMPYERSGGSEDGFWYSFNYGNVHYVSISSENDLTTGSPQQTWLVSDLTAATSPEQRAIVPWIVLVIHKPLYCSADGTPGGYADLLEALCLQYDIDITITGHMHCYERVHPVQSGEVTVYPNQITIDNNLVDAYYSYGKGPVHVVQGSAGGMQGERWQQPAPAWSAIRFANGFIAPNISSTSIDVFTGDKSSEQGYNSDRNYTNTFGFGLITAYNASHLHYNVIPITGNVGVDQFWVIKQERSSII